MVAAQPAEADEARADLPAVQLRDVSVRYRAGRDGHELPALLGVDLEIAGGEFVSIIGPSGCGKTSLLRVIGGLLEPSSGAVAVLGAKPEVAQRRKRLGLVFQEPALLAWRSVAANIHLPLEVNRQAGAPPHAVKQQGSGERPRPVEQLMDLVGLAKFASYRPHELSGGMQQRVALARALAFDPDILLMDEPFGALDEITREQMRYELLRIWSAAGGGETARRRTVVFVTHSVTEAVVLSDRVLLMSSQPGRIVADVRVGLPRPRRPEAEGTPAFAQLVGEVRQQLREAGT